MIFEYEILLMCILEMSKVSQDGLMCYTMKQNCFHLICVLLTALAKGKEGGGSEECARLQGFEVEIFSNFEGI